MNDKLTISSQTRPWKMGKKINCSIFWFSFWSLSASWHDRLWIDKMWWLWQHL